MSSAGNWTADDVKDALRRRHPATQMMGRRRVPGEWTCVEELFGIDLLAVSAVKRPRNGPAGGSEYPLVGYEVKVSRADLRRELRDPSKRAHAVTVCHAFYLAVCEGVLTDAELAARDPAGDQERTLWTPRDVGLIQVGLRGCEIVHRAPVTKHPRPLTGRELGVAVRHASSHPDPRHDGIVEADRQMMRDLRTSRRRVRRRP